MPYTIISKDKLKEMKRKIERNEEDLKFWKEQCNYLRETGIKKNKYIELLKILLMLKESKMKKISSGDKCGTYLVIDNSIKKINKELRELEDK